MKIDNQQMTDQQINPQFYESEEIIFRKQHYLVLHNDSSNTFDFVIKTLVEECQHDTLQAQQCAILVHHKGKCEISQGDLFELQNLKNRLSAKGLTVTIVEE